MAYSEDTASGLRNVLDEKGIVYSEKNMFSGFCFMVDDKLCCGTHRYKNMNQQVLMYRVGEDVYQSAVEYKEYIAV